MEPSVKGVKGALKICTNGHGLLTKMAAIYGKKKTTTYKSFSRTKKALRLNLGL